MKYSFLKKDRKKSLILFFAGWSMDTTPFTGLSQLDCDSVVVYDYTDLSLEKNILDGYANVFVFAWSFGVYAAAYWLQKENVRPTMAVAINGTLSPIDDEQGIPVGVFNGTLENLSEKSLLKFYRRMCQSTEQYTAFMSSKGGQRPILLTTIAFSQLPTKSRHGTQQTLPSHIYNRHTFRRTSRLSSLQTLLTNGSSSSISRNFCPHTTLTPYAKAA